MNPADASPTPCPAQPTLEASTDDPRARCVEVAVHWGETLLHIEHLALGASFELSSDGALGKGRFVVDAAMLPDGRALRVVEPTANGPCVVASDGARVPLEGGVRVREVGPLRVSARVLPRGKSVHRRARIDGALALSGALAIALVGTLLATSLAFAPASPLLSANSEGDDPLAALRAFVERVSERAPVVHDESRRVETAVDTGDDEDHRPGSPTSRPSLRRNARYATRAGSPQSTPSTRSAREALARRGVFAGLRAMSASVPSSAYGELASRDDADALAGTNGIAGPDVFGYGGLGFVGTGTGRGGAGEQPIESPLNGFGGTDGATCGYSWRTRVVRGRTVTIARTDSDCDAGTLGHGIGMGRLGMLGRALPEHRVNEPATHAPLVRAAAPEVNGIDPGIIRRVVRRNLPQVEHCHSQGLAQDPQLAGRVVVGFVLRRDGSVIGSAVRESNLGAHSVAECIAHAVRRWSFPIPSDGPETVAVTYPFLLSAPM